MAYGTVTDIDAVVFDIDGTLYPTWKFSFVIFPFLLKNRRFMCAFKKIRRQLHMQCAAAPDIPLTDFFAVQKTMLAAELDMHPEQAGYFLDEYIYRGWKKHFLAIRPYPFAKEAVIRLKQAGLKIGLLSDFPVEQKGSVWGILEYCDAVLGSETLGALKPSHVPFRHIARNLNVPANRVLYVGNSPAYDVAGAAGAGMKTACIQNPLKSFLGEKVQGADISFSNYRQLLEIVLK